MRLASRLGYFIWCVSHGLQPDTSCPGCENRVCRLLKRKMLVTQLFECPECGLRFRVPKDDESLNRTFYQEDYDAGFTSMMPSRAELSPLLENGFADSEKNYELYIEVLKAVGLQPPAVLLDFGCSWGYGSWQLRNAGFDVISYEISKPRAAYAASMLGLRLVDDPSRPPYPVDCFFSAHVMEHLADPNVIWGVAASALKPHGIFIAFVPNGNPEIEVARRGDYHRLWGKVHPLLITSKHLKHIADRYRFTADLYSSPYLLDDITNRRAGSLTGDELLIVARR